MDIEGKPALGYCELPTGIKVGNEILKTVHFREMAGPEEDLFANKKMGVTKKLTTIMQNCITKIGDVEDREEISKIVNKIVGTDRFYILIQLRILSVDSILSFKTTCPRCQHEDKVLFDLNGVTIKDPPDAERLFKEVKLPSGHEVRIKVSDAKAEEVIEKATTADNAISLALASRVESFGGKPVNLSDIIKLSMKDRRVLRKAIDELEGELDDEYTAKCPKCDHEYKGNLPLAGSDFLGL